MKRYLAVAALFLLGAGTASADYVLVKININQLDFFPGGGQTDMKGGPPGMMMGGGPGGKFGGGGPNPGGLAGGGYGGNVGGGYAGAGGGAGGGSPRPGGAGGGIPNPGGLGGGLPSGGGYAGGPGQPKGGPSTSPADDPNAKWVFAIIEIKNPLQKPAQNQFGQLYSFEHKWGKNNWLPISKSLPIQAKNVQHISFAKEFDRRFAEQKADKNKSIDNFLSLARWTLSRGQMKEFHKVMEEAEKLNPDNTLVKNYQRVKNDLTRPFKDDDAQQAEILAWLRAQNNKFIDSERGHFRTYYTPNAANDRSTKASVVRRLALMEETLESFYYWFAMQEKSPQPNLPKYRLNSLLAGSKEAFTTLHLQWGQAPMAADGFTPRRDNLVVMSAKPRIQDPVYHEFESILTSKLNDANTKLKSYKIDSVSREDLLSGKINESKAARQAPLAIAIAQTSVVVAKVLEDGAERHTVTNETIRQLLIASEMFPRNVQIPDWMVEGLAAFFETPAGTIYPTIGSPSFAHLVSWKHLNKNKRFASPSETLYNVVTDAYFQEARQTFKDAQENRANEDLQKAARESWEIARCSSWAFIYYLAQTKKLDYLFSYGKELNKLPRDMDLNDQVLQASFGKAFELADTRDARQLDTIKLKNLAGAWFDLLQGTNLDSSEMQDLFAEMRAKLDVRPPQPKEPPNPKGGPNPGGGNPYPGGPGGIGGNPYPGGNPNPGGQQRPPNAGGNPYPGGVPNPGGQQRPPNGGGNP